MIKTRQKGWTRGQVYKTSYLHHIGLDCVMLLSVSSSGTTANSGNETADPLSSEATEKMDHLVLGW